VTLFPPLFSSVPPPLARAHRLSQEECPCRVGRGLVPVVRLTYAASGGAYQGLHLVHVEGCRNDSLFFTDKMQGIVSHLDLRCLDHVETVCTCVLAAHSFEVVGPAWGRCLLTELPPWVFRPGTNPRRAPQAPSPTLDPTW